MHIGNLLFLERNILFRRLQLDSIVYAVIHLREQKNKILICIFTNYLSRNRFQRYFKLPEAGLNPS